ncbi:MAG: hypothetical protein Q9226_009265 [Calogaya cf. arnoldii]
MENSCDFEAKYTIGNNKQGDSAEIGVYRNNWHMIRDYCDDFKGASSDEWETRGMKLQYVDQMPFVIEQADSRNSGDVAAATKCQRQLMNDLGETTYFGLQRGGAGKPELGKEYRNIVMKYWSFVKDHMTDGICTWWYLEAI